MSDTNIAIASARVEVIREAVLRLEHAIRAKTPLDFYGELTWLAGIIDEWLA